MAPACSAYVLAGILDDSDLVYKKGKKEEQKRGLN